MAEAGVPELVAVAAAVRARRAEPAEFDAAFATADVFARRMPDQPGVVAANLGEKGRWVLAFSTEERFARAHGDASWVSLTGADLLGQLPPGVGVLLDVGSPHGLPLLPQPQGRARFSGALLPPRPTGAAR